MNGVNFASAIQKCLEYVETEAQITLDIAICSYFNPGTESEVGKTVENFQRAREINKQTPGDVYDFMMAYPQVNYRYLFLEQNGDGGLNFDNSTTTWRLQEMGRFDAQAALELGEGHFFMRLEEWE